MSVLEEVVAELRMAHPGVGIEMHSELFEAVDCDVNRIAQLFSNLVGNAVKHGDTNRTIRIHAQTDEGAFKLSVVNSGNPIPPHAQKRLFQPYSRGNGNGNPQGLGLGLYIASEIAQAHGGMLTVSSTSKETRFTFQMPQH